MSTISLLFTLVAVVIIAAQPPLPHSLVSRLSPVLRDPSVTAEISDPSVTAEISDPSVTAESESGQSSASPEESDEYANLDVQQSVPLVRAHKDYRYTPLVKHPRPNEDLAHYRPQVIKRPTHPKPQDNRYNFCGIALSGTQNHAKHAQADVKPTVIPPKMDVELVYGNYCGNRKTGGNKLLGMQVIACDLGGKEKPYIIEQFHNEDSVKFNHFDVFGTQGGVIVFAKQFCGYRIG